MFIGVLLFLMLRETIYICLYMSFSSNTTAILQLFDSLLSDVARWLDEVASRCGVAVGLYVLKVVVKLVKNVKMYCLNAGVMLFVILIYTNRVAVGIDNSDDMALSL